MLITIDENAGFCWGVVRAVQYAEKELDNAGKLYCLGEIIHNPIEIERLKKRGLETISVNDLKNINREAKVLIRAHGEPPLTYKLATANGIELIDATCPIVKKVQERIKSFFENGYQIIIFGKKEHPEVIGLNGVCDNNAIIIKSKKEAEVLNLLEKNVLFSQTTMDKSGFKAIVDILTEKTKKTGDDSKIELLINDTICCSVSDREICLQEFSTKNDAVIFVSGRNSSNGKMLFEICASSNPQTYFIEGVEEIKFEWLDGKKRIGITGATSTPKWVIEEVKEYILKKFYSHLIN
jgi:4-hydroxy-3-methylbut-2-enyl diphosphate reductase